MDNKILSLCCHLYKLDDNTLVSFKYIWHILTAENFIFGIAFIIIAFHKKFEALRFAAWLIAVILTVRLFIILTTTLITIGGQIHDLIINIVAIIAYVTLIISGTRSK